MKLNKSILLLVTILILSLSIANAAPHKKLVINPIATLTWDGPGVGPPDPVTVPYVYTHALELIDLNFDDINICEYNKFHDRWIPMENTVHDKNDLTISFDTHGTELTVALCLINPDAVCEFNPSANSFKGNLPTTTANMDKVSVLFLERGGTRIQWNELVDVCGAPLDTAIDITNTHVAIDAEVLDDSINSNPTITFQNVDCNDFALYYYDGFKKNTQAIIAHKDIIADENSNDCINSICSEIQCSDNTLTFIANSLSSIAVESGASPILENPGGAQISHVITNRQIDFTFQGIQPFTLNIRGDNNMGEEGGFVWVITDQSSFNVDLNQLQHEGTFNYYFHDSTSNEWIINTFE